MLSKSLGMNSHWMKFWRSRLHKKLLLDPTPANCTVAVSPLTVTPSPMRWTAHIPGSSAWQQKCKICNGHKSKILMNVWLFPLPMKFVVQNRACTCNVGGRDWKLGGGMRIEPNVIHNYPYPIGSILYRIGGEQSMKSQISCIQER